MLILQSDKRDLNR